MAGFLQHPGGKAFPMSKHIIASIGERSEHICSLAGGFEVAKNGLTSQLLDIIVKLIFSIFRKASRS